VVRPIWLNRLFKFDDNREAAHFLEGWNTRAWRFVGEMLCRRSFLELFSKDPASGASCPPRCRCIAASSISCTSTCTNHLARDSHLLQLGLLRRYIYEPRCPSIFCRARTSASAKPSKTTKITIVTAPAAVALADIADKAIDAYSIAEVSSYLSEGDFGTLMDEIMRTARTDARLCSRGIFVHRPLPPEHVHRVHRDVTTLNASSPSTNLAMVHEFVVGKL